MAPGVVHVYSGLEVVQGYMCAGIVQMYKVQE
jgi:hypothetical protein